MILALDQTEQITWLQMAGPSCFGLVVGYITYRTLARTTANATINDLAVVIAAIGGGTITLLFGKADGSMFGLYAIGLVVGMALYFLMLCITGDKDSAFKVLGVGKGPRQG